MPSIHTLSYFSLGLCASVVSSQSLPGSSFYEAPAGFPTSAFSSYWQKPQVTQEPQPIQYDPVLNITYPFNLTNPETIPTNVTSDPLYYPAVIANLTLAGQQAVINQVISQIGAIITDTGISGNCSKCLAALSVGKTAALLAPSLVPAAMVQLCSTYKLHSNSTCHSDFDGNTFGDIWTQILAYADVSGLDGEYICNSIGGSTYCPAPKTSLLNTTGLFPKAKPANATVPKASGKRVKVLHMSDFHLDPRYSAGSEANCTSSLCCRANNANTALPAGQISLASPLYGSFLCDTPYDLGLAALESVGPLTGTNASSPFAWTVYTGDLVSHEGQNELSRAYVEYTELTMYDLFKKYVAGPWYTALGNHDTNPEAIDAPHSMPGNLSQQMSWNFNHVAGLWQQEGWINSTIASSAATHYGAYSVKNQYGLRIITFNTDFWYHSNFLNFINTTNPDVSGQFQFMIQELQAAEDAGERVWIIGHVLSGWDGTNPLPNPTNLFYQIIDRYSPHVIANVFFGHTHEDQFMIYYANNGTNMTASNALTTGWIGPSVTPLTNLNSGFRMYDVDTGDFNIYDAYTFYSNVSAYQSFNNSQHGPTFEFEYSTREAYGSAANWSATDPLNATFWHQVTEAMELDNGLVSLFNTFQGKSSVKTPNCTNAACAEAKICYMRSGSVALAGDCATGYGSVQSAFTPAAAA